MDQINCIIFSKNRACQLDMLLRSINEMWINRPEIFIIYKAEGGYNSGYDICKREHNNFMFVEEGNFKNDLLRYIEIKKEYIMFLMDDNVFKEKFEFKGITFFSDLLCLSLRLHPKLNYCYPKMKKMKPILKTFWNWKTEGEMDFAYPMSLDGHIFRTEDIFSLLRNLNYNNPNSLESELARNVINKPMMASFSKSPIMNIPWNRVQKVFNNQCGNVTADYLHTEYMKGKRLSLEGIRGFENISAHQEMPVKWE